MAERDKPLTEIQKAFLEAWVRSESPTVKDIAKETGISYDYAKQLVKMPHIKQAISERRAELWKKYEIETEEFILRLCRMAQAPDILAKFKKVDPHNGRIYWDYRGATKEELALATVNGPEKDAMAAMTLLAKILGLGAEKKEITGPNGGPIEINVDNEELARRIAFVLADQEK